MNKTVRHGLAMAFAAIMMISCNQDNVVSESNPQVTNHQVSISLFDQSMDYIGRGTRADVAHTLKSSKIFSELEVALIPIGNETDSGYVIRQDSIDEKFGTVELVVPAGNYHMVAIAAATRTPSKGRITIKSNTEVRFPEDKVTDMVYAYRNITVTNSNSSEKQSFAASLTRPVICFFLSSTDTPPSNLAYEEIEITGSCGYVFNPSTGKCKEEATVYRKYMIDPVAHKKDIIHFKLYAIPSGKSLTKAEVKATAKDVNDNAIRSCKFDDVTFEIGKYTHYTGPVFTNDNSVSFAISSPDWEENVEYSKTFY